ncbi:HsdM family class I SAM-dependent methyltransferase [Oceanobacillus massiliensis]|uniref:HsdM family class I SAM-dependent methyltransferase n=1 Tax=Oceanobacillus massiliensis TaxID=1465765 RepID=UPI0030180FC9
MKNSYSSNLHKLINRLDFSKSQNLFLKTEFSSEDISSLSYNTQKIISETNPDAYYLLDNEPLIFFYDSTSVFNNYNIKSIWNAQIPIVILIKEDTVTIYNGTKLKGSELKLKKIHEESLYDINRESDFSFWNIAKEEFWSKYKTEFDSRELNVTLLENIEFLTDKLRNIYKIPFSTKLVLRIIFIRFLIDRDVNIEYRNFNINVQKSQEEFLKVVKDKESLYHLFKHMKMKFNGSLFELGDEYTDDSLTPEAFNLLHDFLSGNIKLSNGQLALFPMYDFNIISVELISNIYEILLGENNQQKNKSFYTPSYLAEYMLQNSVYKHVKDYNSCRVLDPSCGSGIFLVKTYKSIIEKNLKNRRGQLTYKNIDSLLVNLLEDNIYGVDLSEEAIDVTIFSLYLTLLEYKDPKTLESFKLPMLLNKNLFTSDFFDDEKMKAIKNVKFDFIIGNPPWGSIDSLHLHYVQQSNKPILRKEISQSFVYKVEEYSSENTIISFVLPAKQFYNKKSPAVRFRSHLLTNTKIFKVIDMSSVRKRIFKNATAPALIISFKYRSNVEGNTENNITHISLKPNLYFELFNLFVIEKNDIKYLKQKLLIDDDWAWKVLIYGTSWDYFILKDLEKKYRSINEVIKKEHSNVIIGNGLQVHPGDMKDASHYLGKKIINSFTGIDHYALNLEIAEIFNQSKIHRVRDPRIFEAPLCLIKKGIDMKDYTMRSVYSEEDVLFKDAITSIKGNDSDKAFLLTLTGLFNSTFYSYLNILLSSSIGIEREQSFFKQVRAFPYPNGKEDEAKIGTLVEKIQGLSRNELLESESDFNELYNAINDQVLKAFNLQNNNFIDFMLNFQLPMIKNEEKQVGNTKVNERDLRIYADFFYNYFNDMYREYGYKIKLKIYPNIANQFACCEVIIEEDLSSPEITVVNNHHFAKEFFSKFSLYKLTDSFYSIKDVLYFEESSFFILKPNLKRNWHPAIAEKDLNEVVSSILSSEEE